MGNKVITVANIATAVSQKVEDYKLLTKFRLSFLVVFSAGIGFLLASPTFDLSGLFVLCLGGFLVTGASNALNQVLEQDLDKQMARTSKRPLASGRMNTNEAVLSAGLMSLLGITLLASFNMMTALIGMISLISYAFVYTPMKRISPIAVIIGAFPGAFPPMIGWVAVTGTLDIEALVLFGIQFLWQFPHFWAIAWVQYEDYAKAGFFLLPTKRKDKQSALQGVIYALILLPISFLPYFLGLTGLISMIIVGIAGLYYAYKSWLLYKECTRDAARKLMFTSFIYLPIVLIALVLDKL
ncbi:MAG: heme o synthase [Saprospiraceae bacterium]